MGRQSLASERCFGSPHPVSSAPHTKGRPTRSLAPSPQFRTKAEPPGKGGTFSARDGLDTALHAPTLCPGARCCPVLSLRFLIHGQSDTTRPPPPQDGQEESEEAETPSYRCDLALGCLSPDVGHHDNWITHLSPISSVKLFNKSPRKRYYGFHLLGRTLRFRKTTEWLMLAPDRPSVPPTRRCLRVLGRTLTWHSGPS